MSVLIGTTLPPIGAAEDVSGAVSPPPALAFVGSSPIFGTTADLVAALGAILFQKRQTPTTTPTTRIKTTSFPIGLSCIFLRSSPSTPLTPRIRRAMLRGRHIQAKE